MFKTWSSISCPALCTWPCHTMCCIHWHRHIQNRIRLGFTSTEQIGYSSALLQAAGSESFHGQIKSANCRGDEWIPASQPSSVMRAWSDARRDRLKMWNLNWGELQSERKRDSVLKTQLRPEASAREQLIIWRWTQSLTPWHYVALNLLRRFSL